MDRAFGELEEAFYESGGVLSQRTCVDNARVPAFRHVERSDPQIALGGCYTETVKLGVPESVELGGYYAFYVADGPDEAEDYVSFEIENNTTT